MRMPNGQVLPIKDLNGRYRGGVHGVHAHSIAGLHAHDSLGVDQAQRPPLDPPPWRNLQRLRAVRGLDPEGRPVGTGEGADATLKLFSHPPEVARPRDL